VVDFVTDTVDFVASVHGAKATRSTFNKVDRVEFNTATKSTATSFRIQVVADLSPKSATKSTVWATKLTISVTVNFVVDLSPVSATVDFVASVYRA